MNKRSIFNKVVVNENGYTQLFCNLMERSRPFKERVLTKVFCFPESVTAGLLDIPFHTQRTLQLEGLSQGRPDVVLSCEEVCVIIEVKTELGRASTNYQVWPDIENEAPGYAKYLQCSKADRKWFIYLLPSGWCFERELRSFAEHQDARSGITYKVVTWEDICSAITVDLRTEPLIDEFFVLLEERFRRIQLSESEIRMLTADAIAAVWKLELVIESVATKAKSADFSIEWEHKPADGSVGFYFKQEHNYILYFGCWTAVPSELASTLCIGFQDDWGAEGRECFLASTTGGFATVPGEKVWTVKKVPYETLGQQDVAAAIWKFLEPIAESMRSWRVAHISSNDQIGCPTSRL